jgi:hypothetical protein
VSVFGAEAGERGSGERGRGRCLAQKSLRLWLSPLAAGRSAVVGRGVTDTSGGVGSWGVGERGCLALKGPGLWLSPLAAGRSAVVGGIVQDTSGLVGSWGEWEGGVRRETLEPVPQAQTPH